MTCEDCKNRIPIPGNCHIGCKNVNAKVQLRHWRGCGIFPLSFDEGIVMSCDGKNQDCADLPNHPLLELMRLLNGRVECIKNSKSDHGRCRFNGLGCIWSEL